MRFRQPVIERPPFPPEGKRAKMAETIPQVPPRAASLQTWKKSFETDIDAMTLVNGGL
jgi:hypothetical protein